MVFSESSNDDELMAAYQNGDEDAFAILYRRHSPRVYGFLMNRLRDRGQADDVFQATFLKLHQARSRYDPTFPFSPWLFTVCKSVLVDHVRKNQRRREDSNDEAIERAADLRGERVDTIDLKSLPAQQQTAIELRYAEGLPFDEIALRLETSPSNVRQIISRGIKKLRLFSGKTGD